MGSRRVGLTERLHFHFSLWCPGEGNRNPLQCSCLEKPRDGGAWWAAVYGVAQSWIRLAQLSSSSSVNICPCSTDLHFTHETYFCIGMLVCVVQTEFKQDKKFVLGSGTSPACLRKRVTGAKWENGKAGLKHEAGYPANLQSHGWEMGLLLHAHDICHILSSTTKLNNIPT